MGSARFDRSRRLRKSHEYSSVFDAAQVRESRGRFLMLARPNSLGHARVGPVVSKRSAPHAVTRNRLKRLIRETFRTHVESLGGWDIVILTRPGAGDADNDRVRRTLEKLLGTLATRENPNETSQGAAR